MQKISLFFERWFWPIVIVLFPFYATFERGVELKFYGSIFLMFVTALSVLINTNQTLMDKKLVLFSGVILTVLFLNRVPSNPLWVFHFTCVSCALL